MQQDLNAILPSNVVVVFPQYFCNVPATPPNPLTSKYLLTVPIPPALGYAGNGNEKVVHETARAYYTNQGDAKPLNLAALQSLAQQIAADYFNWKVDSFDLVYDGTMPWTPNALADEVVWTYSGSSATTRAMSRWDNGEPEEYQHDTCDCDLCPSGSDAYGTTCDCPEGYFSGTLTVVTGFSCSSGLSVTSKTLTIDCGSITKVN